MNGHREPLVTVFLIDAQTETLNRRQGRTAWIFETGDGKGRFLYRHLRRELTDVKRGDGYASPLHGPSELLFETICNLEPTPVGEAEGVGVSSIDCVYGSDRIGITGVVARFVLLDALSDCGLD